MRYGILVPSKDTQALLEAIEYMLDHFRDYYPSEEIARYVRSRFSHEVVGNLLHETYVQVLEEYQKGIYIRKNIFFKKEKK